MYFIIYKTTNKINNKVYIGKHQTKNIEDGYIGSGTLLKDAIKKYGVKNFEREVIFVFDNEEDMNVKEKELVTEEFCTLDTNYNLCVGGKGGFSYVNQNGLNMNREKAQYMNSRRTTWNSGWKNGPLTEEHRKKLSNVKKGKKLTSEHKQKISLSKKNKCIGSLNSQYGKRDRMFITNGINNKKILKTDTIPEGWRKGKVQRRKEMVR